MQKAKQLAPVLTLLKQSNSKMVNNGAYRISSLFRWRLFVGEELHPSDGITILVLYKLLSRETTGSMLSLRF